MSEQTITARIELRYNPVMVEVTGYDALRKRLSDWLSMRRHGWKDRDILDVIDDTIARNADDVRIVSLKALVEDRKVVLRVVIDVTYIVPETRHLIYEDQILEFKDPIIFTNAVLPTLDYSFATIAFDIKASRVKFFI